MHIAKWAQAITAEKRDQVIVVTGKGHYPFPGSSIPCRPDSNIGRWMHIEFANADTDSNLLDFVRHHGPVNGEMLHGELFPPAVHPRAFKSVTVEQPIQKLREGHSAIAPAARLIAALKSEKPVTLETVNRLCSMVGEHIGISDEGVPDVYKSGMLSKKTIKILTKREMSLAADYLCEFLNRVPPKLASVGRHPVELPFYDEGGILPILYYLLRQDFLSDVRTIGVCERCRGLFVVRRQGAQFCSPECSQLKRSLDYYYSKRGSLGRKQRTIPRNNE
jgi:hypothetical protein